MRLEGQRIGRYQIVQGVGSGSMGEVYLAEDTQLSREADEVLLRALAKRPEERFPSITAFAYALERALLGPLIGTMATPYPASYIGVPNTQRPEQVADRSNTSRGRTSLLAGLVLLSLVVSLVSSGLFFYLTKANQGTNTSPNTRSTEQATIAPTATPTSTPIPTSASIVTATSVATNSNPYPPYSGTLVLDDSLSDNSHNYNWDKINTYPDFCQFMGGSYHAGEARAKYYIFCTARATNFTNFVYQVQMTIIGGDQGGIVFRANDAMYTFYFFYITPSGYYQLGYYVDQMPSHAQILQSGFVPSFHQGFNQSNLIAVVANNSNLTLYVNMQEVTSVTDSTYSHGQIAVAAYDNAGDTTEVAFSNAKVWALS